MRGGYTRRAPGGFRGATDAIRADEAFAEAARRPRERLRRLMRWTDAMIEELEMENLKRTDRVSVSWRPRLALLFAALPFDYRPSLRAGPAPVEVLDLIYEVQEHLLDLKNGRPTPGLRRMMREEDDDDWSGTLRAG